MNDNVSPALRERRERVFLILAGLFLGTLAMLNILGISRFLVLASWTTGEGLTWGTVGEYTFAVAVGVLPYPLTFLCTDFISELYGRRRANWVVFVGVILNIWVVAILWLGGLLPSFVPIDETTGYPPLPSWNANKQIYEDGGGWAFFHMKYLAFGAVMASMIAYMAAQFVDVYVFHFWKRLTNGKHLWLRNNGSTVVSQFVDTFAVITITHFYAGALPMNDGPVWPQLWLFIATGYAFKLIAALIDTVPFYIGTHYLSRYLQIDPMAEHNQE